MLLNLFTLLLLTMNAESNAENIRLVGGSDLSEGRVEVFIEGQWGTICDDFWDLNDATVVCHQLGFKEASLAVRNAGFGAGTGPIHLDDVRCTMDELSITECPHVTTNDCRHEEDAGVRCEPYEMGHARLSGGNETSGRLEIYVDNMWKAVCEDQNWNQRNALVACRQLGYREVYGIKSSLPYTREGVYISRTKLHCHGNEKMLNECIYMEMTACSSSYNLQVSCTGLPEGKTEIRLSGGNETAGRVEIYVQNQWGTVCDDHWNLNAGDVVCRQLGFKGAFNVAGAQRYGEGDGAIHFDDVQCSGNEDYLQDCLHLREHDCTHSEDAGVSCVPFETGDMKLIEGNRFSGRIQVYQNRSWGSICFSRWDLTDAMVVCRQLSIGSAVLATSYHSLNEHVTFSLNNVACVGTELSLMECPYEVEGDCEHNVYAGVICEARSDALGGIRLSGGNKTAGRVEVFYDDQWGTVCDDEWDMNDARVVCRQLGFKTAYHAFTNAAFGLGRGPIHFENVGCRGYELSLVECSKSKNKDCDHREDAGVSCNPFITILTVSVYCQKTTY